MTSTALEQARMTPAGIRRLIHVVRAQNVILDSDLAALYDVETKALVRAMKRNPNRFPGDFAFQLTAEEWKALRCQTGTSNEGRGGRRYAPYAFAEQGVAMLSSVLRSGRAAAVNVAIMRAFVAMRHELAAHADLAGRLDELERNLKKLGSSTENQFDVVFKALRALLVQPERKRKPVGLTAEIGG